MFDYYSEEWLDKLEGRFEAIVEASQKARRLNEGEEKDPGSVEGKVVVRALRGVLNVKGEDGEEKKKEAKATGKGKDKKTEKKGAKPEEGAAD